MSDTRESLTGRVSYTKLVDGEPVDVTADFFSNGSYSFMGQDRWEVRGYTFEPSTSELAYAIVLLKQGVNMSERIGLSESLDEEIAYEFVAYPRSVDRNLVRLRKHASHAQIDDPLLKADLGRVVELIKQGRSLAEGWCRLKMEIATWDRIVHGWLAQKERRGSHTRRMANSAGSTSTNGVVHARLLAR